MRIYLAGPMTGIPDHNYPLFDHVTEQLRQQGHEVFNPADLTRMFYGSLDNFLSMDSEHQLKAIRILLAKELTWIAVNAEAIYLLPGWENSYGARAEYALGAALKLELVPVPEEMLANLQVVD